MKTRSRTSPEQSGDSTSLSEEASIQVFAVWIDADNMVLAEIPPDVPARVGWAYLDVPPTEGTSDVFSSKPTQSLQAAIDRWADEVTAGMYGFQPRPAAAAAAGPDFSTALAIRDAGLASSPQAPQGIVSAPSASALSGKRAPQSVVFTSTPAPPDAAARSAPARASFGFTADEIDDLEVNVAIWEPHSKLGQGERLPPGMLDRDGDIIYGVHKALARGREEAAARGLDFKGAMSGRGGRGFEAQRGAGFSSGRTGFEGSPELAGQRGASFAARERAFATRDRDASTGPARSTQQSSAFRGTQQASASRQASGFQSRSSQQASPSRSSSAPARRATPAAPKTVRRDAAGRVLGGI